MFFSFVTLHVYFFQEAIHSQCGCAPGCCYALAALHCASHGRRLVLELQYLASCHVNILMSLYSQPFSPSILFGLFSYKEDSCSESKSKKHPMAYRASLLGARTLLGAPGHTTRSKKLLGTKGIATRNKEAARSAPAQIH